MVCVVCVQEAIVVISENIVHFTEAEVILNLTCSTQPG